MRESLLDVRGTNVRILEAGTGPTILFLHGIDGPASDPLLSELARHHHVIVPEIPGFARSPIPDWMMSTSDAAYFMLDLVETLGMAKLHLAGHSIGGWIAAEMAIRSTARLASLSLLAPAGAMPPDLPKEDVFLITGDDGVRALFHDQTAAGREIEARAGREIDITLQNRAGLARLGWTPRLASVMLPHWLHRINVPTLVAWGEDDRIIPFSTHEIFVREIAGAELLRLPACGHALTIERGAEIARRMSALIAGAAR